MDHGCCATRLQENLDKRGRINDSSQQSPPDELLITRGPDRIERPESIDALHRLARGQLGEPLLLRRDSEIATDEVKHIVTNRPALCGRSLPYRIMKVWRHLLDL